MSAVPLILLLLSGVIPPAGPSRGDDSTPAERAIARAREAIARQPRSCDPHNALALAYARRAREIASPALYDRAGEELDRSLELQPDNFTALKLRVWVLLGRHEFSRALAAADALQRRAPDDLQVNAFLVDALVELGRYEQAEKAAQWLLDLHPGNIAGLTRAAYLRELFGDPDGSLELMEAAYQRTPPDEVEDRAWLMTRMAHLLLSGGHLDEATTTVRAALELFPGYHDALSVEAEVLTAQGRLPEAALVRERHVGVAPHAENFFAFAESLERAGDVDRARALYVDFEAAARREIDSPDNANRELALYYAGRGGRPDEALRIARLEFDRRQDVFTRSVLAWALFVNGDVDEARRQSEAALSVGLRDARLRERAALIAAAAAGA